jgi:hypothetical protein
MNYKPKTAICFSGQARGVIEGYQGIRNNLLAPNSPDVFVHVWGEESHGQVKAISDLYRPTAMVVEPQRHFANSRLDIERQRAKYHHGYNPQDFVDRTYSMQYSILQANLVKERYRLANDIHYDCVIRARFDLGFSCPVACSGYDMSAVYLFERGLPEMLDDRFAFGPNHLMNIYSSGFCFYDLINKIRSAKDGIFGGETILYEMLRACGVEHKLIAGVSCWNISGCRAQDWWGPPPPNGGGQ